MLDGKERVMGLGPVMGSNTLSEARHAVGAARALLRQGLDPIEHRSAARRASAAVIAKAAASTFRVVADDYLAAHSVAWRNAKHRAQWGNTLATYAHPTVGSLPIAEVDTDAILRVLNPIWNAKPETASRVRGRIEAVLDYAIARGLREGSNPARWRGAHGQAAPQRQEGAQGPSSPGPALGNHGKLHDGVAGQRGDKRPCVGIRDTQCRALGGSAWCDMA